PRRVVGVVPTGILLGVHRGEGKHVDLGPGRNRAGVWDLAGGGEVLQFGLERNRDVGKLEILNIEFRLVVLLLGGDSNEFLLRGPSLQRQNDKTKKQRLE